MSPSMPRAVPGAFLGALLAALLLPLAAWAQDALPSWTDGPAKQAIVAYVAKVTAPGPDFTPPPVSDQRGAPFVRVFHGRIDIGSFEVQPLPRSTPSPRPRPTPLPRP